VILVDTSGLLAALDAAQRLHREVAASVAAASPPLLLSPFVLAGLTTSSRRAWASRHG
jgi:predicted nucleic acid-binding protein